MGTMVEKYERWFLYLTAVLLAAFFGAIVLSVTESNAHLQTDYGSIDPAEVRTTAPFDNPGVHQISGNASTRRS